MEKNDTAMREGVLMALRERKGVNYGYNHIPCIHVWHSKNKEKIAHKEHHALNNNNDLGNCFKKAIVKLELLFCE